MLLPESESDLGVAASERRVGSWPWLRVDKVDRVRHSVCGGKYLSPTMALVSWGETHSQPLGHREKAPGCC